MDITIISKIPVAKSVKTKIREAGLAPEDMTGPDGYKRLLDINGIGIAMATKIMAYNAALLESGNARMSVAVLNERVKAHFGDLLKPDAGTIRARALFAIGEAVEWVAQNDWDKPLADYLEDIQHAAPPKGQEPVGVIIKAEGSGPASQPGPPPVPAQPGGKPASEAVYHDEHGPDSPRAAAAGETPHG